MSASFYLFKVNNRNTKKRCKICSKFTITTAEQRHDVVLVFLKIPGHIPDSISPMDSSPKDTSPTDISPTRHIPNGHFPNQTIKICKSCASLKIAALASMLIDLIEIN